MNGSQCIQSIHDILFIFIIHTGNYLQCSHYLLYTKLAIIIKWNEKHWVVPLSGPAHSFHYSILLISSEGSSQFQPKYQNDFRISTWKIKQKTRLWLRSKIQHISILLQNFFCKKINLNILPRTGSPRKTLDPFFLRSEGLKEVSIGGSSQDTNQVKRWQEFVIYYYCSIKLLILD